MKSPRRTTSDAHKLLLVALFLALAPAALASSTWYVNGANGSDGNNCKSPQTACKTIGHAVSLCHSGDSIMVAPATYKEHLIIGISLNIIGSSAAITMVDGGGKNTVFYVSRGATVGLSNLTIRNGYGQLGGGIDNNGTLAINNGTINGNSVVKFGGGIYNNGTLIINGSTMSGNVALAGGGIDTAYGRTLTVINSTISGNIAKGLAYIGGGGISNAGSNASLTINNSTISGNKAPTGGGIYGGATLQNTIVANNSGGNCDSTKGSKGYNLSSDNTCHFNGPGDMNNINPKLGTLGNNGGPTQTIPLLAGSPATDAGNPSGCTDGKGHLLKADQRGYPRPDKEDASGCDMGAYERQSD